MCPFQWSNPFGPFDINVCECTDPLKLFLDPIFHVQSSVTNHSHIIILTLHIGILRGTYLCSSVGQRWVTIVHTYAESTFAGSVYTAALYTSSTSNFANFLQTLVIHLLIPISFITFKSLCILRYTNISSGIITQWSIYDPLFFREFGQQYYIVHSTVVQSYTRYFRYEMPRVSRDEKMLSQIHITIKHMPGLWTRTRCILKFSQKLSFFRSFLPFFTCSWLNLV